MEVEALSNPVEISRSSSPPTVAESVASHLSSNALDSQELPNAKEEQQNTEDGVSQEKAESSQHSSAANVALLEKHESDFLDQKEKRKQRLIESALDKTHLPELYFSNSKKEVLVGAYVDNFIRQYGHLYPGRRELLLMSPNEFGIKVF
jgi:hypothetical protein